VLPASVHYGLVPEIKVLVCQDSKNTTEGGSPQHTELKNQQQQEKMESILFFFAERKQKVAVNFKDV